MIDTDRRVYEEVREYKITHDGRSPSLRDLAKMFGDLTHSAVSLSLRRLEHEGLVEILGFGYGKGQVIRLVGERIVYYPPPPLED